MATGTGKTKTAVEATRRLYQSLRNRNQSLTVLVVCPYISLVDQWAEAFSDIGWQAIKAYDDKSTWTTEVASRLKEHAIQINAGHRVVIITTQATFTGEAMPGALRNMTGNRLLIADEVHNLGTAAGLGALPSDFDFRLGLSATPERHNDSVGTAMLYQYFGAPSFEYSLADGISQGWLSSYKYFPRVVKMNFDEAELYNEYSLKISSLMGGREFEELSKSELETLGKVLRRRGSLLGSIDGKWKPFWQDIQTNDEKKSQLVYCAEGASPMTPSLRQIDLVKQKLDVLGLGGSAVYESATDRLQRKRILEDFKSGNVKHLLSMRCLDEGVDIPNAEVGYLLASSANPRQFIQRRGRLLRPHQSKEYAIIYDYFVDSGSQTVVESPFEISLRKKEMARAREFVAACMNFQEASSLIKDMGDV